MILNNVFWLVAIVSEAAVVGLLIYRRVWRILPVFCVFCVWDLLFANIGSYAIFRFYPASYFTAYLVETIVDSVLEFGVLVELAWSVLRPVRSSLPRGALAIVGGLVAVLGGVIWPIAVVPGFGSFPPGWHFLIHLQQTAAILRILFFLVLAGCSQLLSIGWRNRELQVATGLGIYSLAGFAVAILRTHASMASQYRHLDQFLVASGVCSLLYWVFSFAHKEAERREFGPQMQSMLLAVAGAARTTRIALSDSVSDKAGKRRGR
jgi:hypothetical protein